MADFTVDQERHEYWLGKRKLASITQLLKVVGIIRESGFTNEYDMWEGSASHKAIELYIRGTLDQENLDKKLRPRLDAYLKFIALTGFQPTMVEQPLYDEAAGIAGTPDIVGVFPDGSVGIIDEKNGNIRASTAIQAAGYWFLINRFSHPIRLFGLRLAPNGVPQIVEFDTDEPRTVFMNALSVFSWVRNHGGWK